jgi:tripartite-type tricarboxylate transporter receptor subunit TctC
MKKVLSAIFCVILAIPVSALANTLPFKQVTIITHFPVGSGPDAMVRKISETVTRLYNIPVVMENKPGGQGAIALAACNTAVNSVNNVNICYADSAVVWALPLITGKDEYTTNLKNLFTTNYADLGLIVSPDIKTLSDLKTAIKKTPNYGSWSVGSTGQVSSMELLKALNLKAEHIPYKDYSQWLIDVSTGRLAFSFATLGSSQPLIAAGKIKFIAIGTPARDPEYPAIPTVNEFLGKNSGFIPIKAIGMYMVKKDMSVIDQQALSTMFITAMKEPVVKADIASRLYRIWPYSQAETPMLLEKEERNYLRAIKEYNIEMKQ